MGKKRDINISFSDLFVWGKKFKKLYCAFSNKVRKKYGLKQIDLEIIFYLDQNPDASIGDIHRKMYRNKGQLSLAITELKKKGYIHTEKSDTDQRYTHYELTEKTRTVISEIYKIIDYSTGVLMEGITAEEKRNYFITMTQIVSNVDKLEKECK